MTIQNPKAFCAGLWDWGFLDAHLPGRIKVGDADGLLEIAGNFLLIETKAPGVPIPTGQEIMFKRWARRQGMTVLVLWGNTNDPRHGRLYLSNDRTRDFPDLTEARVQKIVRDWVAWAKARPYQPQPSTPR